MKILLAVDGSKFTKKMLAYLTTHEELLGSGHNYTVLHVQAHLPPRVRAALGKGEVDAYHAEEGDKVLSPVLKFLRRHAIEPTLVTKVGHAGELIAQQANTGHFNLLVMGSHGHSALENLVLGSVTTKVLAHTSVPVLLVR